MEWISVKDRLPDTEVNVLCINDSNHCKVLYLGLDGYFYNGDCYIIIGTTHWMPLPEPPNQISSEHST